MGLVESIGRGMARRITMRAPRPAVRHSMVSAHDLAWMGIVPLEALAEGTAPIVERRKQQTVGMDTEGVVMRRRASDWRPADAEASVDERGERRLA